MNTRNAYPLVWPSGWKRHSSRFTPLFDWKTTERSVTELLHELKLLRVMSWEVIISTNLQLRNDGLPRSNQQTPVDPGVAVYFKLNGQDRVLACDKWRTVEYNILAIARHISAIRAQERGGVGNVAQAFAGYVALMSGREVKPWHEVMGVPGFASTDDVISKYRDLSFSRHPDRGGSDQAMALLNEAYAAFKKERGL